MSLPAMRRPVYAGDVCPRLLNLDSRADVGEKQLVRKFCIQLGRTDLTGAVRNAKTIKFQPRKVVNCCGELLITGRAKVRATDNCMNPRFTEVSSKPFNSIDQAGMCATEKDHETFVDVYGESYVIGKRVGGPCVSTIGTPDQVWVACFQR